MGAFLDSKSQTNKTLLYDVIPTSKWREGKRPINCLWKMHMTTSLFVQYSQTSIQLLLRRDYDHMKFGLVRINESKVMEGGGGI